MKFITNRGKLLRLTDFYLYLAIGGALGGVFNAILAPMLFKRILELPIVIILAVIVYKNAKYKKNRRQRLMDLLWPLFIGGFTALLAVIIPSITLKPFQLWLFIIFGIPLFISYVFADHPLRFGLAIGAIIVGSMFFSISGNKVLYSDRNFFGTIQIIYDKTGPYHKLFHGTTQHGIQFKVAEREDEPLAYYHKNGPFGQIFKLYQSKPASHSVAVIGLGIGSMLAYATPTQTWTFYEIDPAIIRIAQNSKYFTHIQSTQAVNVNVIPGDARIKIRKAESHEYGLMVIDAFSSDSIPLHLITKEAFNLYSSKLAKDGLLAINITNKYLDFTQVIANLASELGFLCIQKKDFFFNYDYIGNQGRYASHWAVMAPDSAQLHELLKDKQWKIIKPNPQAPLWTDNFSNIIGILKWF